ncbi:transmembrane protein 243 [Patagioenas fasciata monilis]|uniref:Transmembrane protein 243 n=1 Tax=Patagioenas fasciata monilis TaxID=372326 RepID=A0A1V4K042_PATFA|nr:transmembrane protein 243 [Patagioenas fasciata monilis]
MGTAGDWDVLLELDSYRSSSPSCAAWQTEDRVINLVVGGLTSLLLVVTLISAFVFPQLPPKPVNIFFAFCISLCCISAGILIYWYRQGDLEPKFRNLIYYILFSIVMLCICANLYFHEVGK